jgi:predicted Rossmann fold nucleotide-binding protein DprA/Smf involved in DNA uptake
MKMKALKKDLQSVIKSLNVLTAKAERIAKQLDALEEVQTTQTRSVKAPKPSAKMKVPETATEVVLGIINRHKKGIDTATLKKKTDFDTKTIRNVIFRLKKQGKVQSTTRGIYMAS